MRRMLLLVSSIAIGCGGSTSSGGTADAPPATADAPTDGNGGNGGDGGNSGGNDGGTTVAGCAGATLLAVPSDPKARGPWPVGARTATIGRLTVEIWYPATPGSDAGAAHARYDLRKELPAAEAAKIPDVDNPWQDCDCVRDLPIDGAHGPYPIVLFVHGTAAFRHQSLPIVTHWASRGFVVVAADHPGLELGDFLAQLCNEPTSGSQDLSGDLDAMIAALDAPTPQADLAFLAGHLDTARKAVAGHSAGANAVATASTKPGVQVVIAMAGNAATAASADLRSTLYLGGESDTIVSWGSVKTAWGGSPTPRRLVEVGNAGHLAFSDICQIENAQGQDLLTVANDDQVCGANLAGFLFDCKSSYVDGPTGWDITNYASSGVLEDALQCAQGLPDLSTIQSAVPGVKSYQQAL